VTVDIPAAGIRSVFQEDGGLRLMSGPLGRGVKQGLCGEACQSRARSAPRSCLRRKGALKAAFEAGKLDRDLSRGPGSGPAANGMPELHWG